MSRIITPKPTLKRGRESWLTKTDTKRNTQPTKLERTGQNTFNVTHEDGSVFECKMDPSKVRLKKDSIKDAGGSSRFFIPGTVKPKVMSNKDRKRLGVPLDPDLEE